MVGLSYMYYVISSICMNLKFLTTIPIAFCKLCKWFENVFWHDETIVYKQHDSTTRIEPKN